MLLVEGTHETLPVGFRVMEHADLHPTRNAVFGYPVVPIESVRGQAAILEREYLRKRAAALRLAKTQK